MFIYLFYVFRTQVISSASNSSKLPRPAQPKANVVKPFNTGRTLGLKKADCTETKPKVAPLAVIVPQTPSVDIGHDIDKDDEGKPFLVPEYANEIYSYLRQLEVSVYGKEFKTKHKPKLK